MGKLEMQQDCNLKKDGSCRREWVSMEKGQFVMEHHSCLISGLDVPRRVHLKERLSLHNCIYMPQESCRYTLFMPVCTISSRWLTVTSHWLKCYKISGVTHHENHSPF